MLSLIPKKAQLDKLCGEIVRARGKCQRCGTTESLTWAHIISRNCLRIRWNPQNALCLCFECHHFFDQTATGKRMWPSFVKSVIGEHKYEELLRMSSYNWNTFERVDFGKVAYDLKKMKKYL